MDAKKRGGTKKKRLLFVLLGLIALTLPGILTYLTLGVFYRAQGGVVRAEKDQTSTRLDTTSHPRAITVTSHRDFGAVCGGFTIKNAAKYEGKKSALIVTFSQSPRTKDSWSYEDVGYGKTYTKTEGDFTKINTVACLHEIRDTKVFSKNCRYDQNGEMVEVRYYSIRYKLSYYEARTGVRIADGGIIEAPAGECPVFAAYDEQTLTAYAAPENEAIDLAHNRFITQ